MLTFAARRRIVALLRQIEILRRALWRLFENSGFSMAGAIAYSFVVALFPFCIFLGALAGMLGGREFASRAVAMLFEILPGRVAEALGPEVVAVMSQSRVDLLTIGALVALFFATSAVESLRSALNVAYHVSEQRSYLWCLAQSALFVIASAIGALAVGWWIVLGPKLAARYEAVAMLYLLDSGPYASLLRYLLVAIVVGLQLFAYHIWLAAGRRTLREVWPGVLLTIVLWLLLARLFSAYLDFNDYSRFYAGLTQLLSALIFFQVTGMIIILGAEFNRCLAEAALEEAQARAEERRAAAAAAKESAKLAARDDAAT